MSTPNPEPEVDVCLYHGGDFRVTGKTTDDCSDGVEYTGGSVLRLGKLKRNELTYKFFQGSLKKLISRENIAFLWYIKRGQPMSIGRTLVCSDKEVGEALNTISELKLLNLYVSVRKKFTRRTPLTLSPVKQKAKNIVGPFNKCTPTQKSISITPKASNTPITLSTHNEITVKPNTQKSVLCETSISEARKRPKLPFKKPGIVIRDVETEEESLVKRQRKEIDKEQGKGKEKCSGEDVFVGEENWYDDGISVETWWNGDDISVREQFECVSGKRKGKKKKCEVELKGKKSSVKPVEEKSGSGKSTVGKKSSVTSVGDNSGTKVVEKKSGGSLLEKRINCAAKLKNKNKGKKDKGKEGEMGVKSVASKKGKGRKRKKGLILEDENNVSEESEYSDLDIEFQIGEDDLREEDIFEYADGGSILRVVEGSLRKEKMLSLRGVDEPEFVFTDDEDGGDSDELVSLNGSDDEMNDVENYPVFKQDFTKNVELSLGLKFANNIVLRKALVRHSVECRYDFYYLHSSNTRVTTYCRYRCNCPWDLKKARIKCSCELRNCFFKIHATRLSDNITFQIKSMNLKHTCNRSSVCTKVSSEYVADRYLEEWRDNPKWDLEAFQTRILRDTGYTVSYQLAWLARSRMKAMVNGDVSEQYSRVWDYAAVVMKYNPGSSAVVVVDNIERPPPIFQRMYICLKACKEGWLAGCRPILRVDGCHLKGPFPGICLVAVGMDGNNNIYPIAWGVVDVENANTWTWFLQLLIEDLEKQDGIGLTFISDRQKGLLDAFKVVASKAEIRYCSRHIWANFKLRFSGQAYKDAFWRAARCTTKVEFDAEMMGIKFLNVDAYEYLAAIEPKFWSRHAFSTSCKSNMLLNNMCESFNNVIKEARGKPILTHMEWMRRYAMKRMCEKRDGAKSVVGNLMPYVSKYLKWVEDQARFCTLTPSSNDVYEIDWRGDSFVVDLDARKCTCYHWQLTGLPCAHAMGCIIDKRGNIEDYIDAAYTKATYKLAYTPSIMPMPGVKHWEKVDAQVEPLPPLYKKLPGRPSLKKRRKEAGEGKTTLRVPKACGKCGQLRHNAKTCNNPTKVAAVKKPPTKPLKLSTYNNKQREAVARRKAKKDRLGGRSNVGPSTEATSNSVPISVSAHTPRHSTNTEAPRQGPSTRSITIQGSQNTVTQGAKAKI